jgi:hypothetical protein
MLPVLPLSVVWYSPTHPQKPIVPWAGYPPRADVRRECGQLRVPLLAAEAMLENCFHLVVDHAAQ